MNEIDIQQDSVNSFAESTRELTLTLAKADDRDHLLAVYQDSRLEELKQASHWSETEKLTFLKFQFDAQAAHYKEHYPQAEFLIINLRDKKIGRLYIEKTNQQICLMDIAIFHQHRGKGFGRYLVEQILNEAQADLKKVVLHVEPDNFAKKLYTKLGFEVVGEISFYQKMEWKPKPINRAVS